MGECEIAHDPRPSRTNCSLPPFLNSFQLAHSARSSLLCPLCSSSSSAAASSLHRQRLRHTCARETSSPLCVRGAVATPGQSARRHPRALRCFACTPLCPLTRLGPRYSRTPAAVLACSPWRPSLGASHHRTPSSRLSTLHAAGVARRAVACPPDHDFDALGVALRRLLRAHYYG